MNARFEKKEVAVKSVSIVDGYVYVKKIKTNYVPEIGSIEREFALCTSWCPSSRAVTMNYMFNRKWWRKTPSRYKLRQMTKEDCNNDEKLRELMIRKLGVDVCETDMRKRYITK
jgi:hypothetical protein